MDRSASRPAGDGGWRATVEQYTPDGALGRLLLAGVTGLGTAVAGFVALALLVSPAGPAAFLAGLLAGAGSLLAGFVTVVALWPVYLSLVGNVESAADYRLDAGSADGRAGREVPPADEAEDDALATLKRRYAAGELSEDEFERRLGDLLEADEAVRQRRDGAGSRDAEREHAK